MTFLKITDKKDFYVAFYIAKCYNKSIKMQHKIL